MAYMLQFPPGPPLPPNVRSPPYVQFSIKGEPVGDDFPKDVPYNLVVHFAPKLKEWVVPAPPANLSQRGAINLRLRKPVVKIDIDADIHSYGLKWIIYPMLRKASLGLNSEIFGQGLRPALRLSVAIHVAWLALELPRAGLTSLETHIMTFLVMHTSITIDQVKEIWDAFPSDSAIVRQMGVNYVNSHIRLEYTQPEYSTVRNWYLSDLKRCRFFTGLEFEFPEFHKASEELMARAREVKIRERAAQEAQSAFAAVMEAGVGGTLGKANGKKVKKLRLRASSEGSAQKKHKRTESSESVASVETVIWNPKPTLMPSKSETEKPHEDEPKGNNPGKETKKSHEDEAKDSNTESEEQKSEGDKENIKVEPNTE